MMDLNISCQHTTLTPALRSYAEEKLSKVARHSSRPVQAHLVLVVDGAVQRAEASVTVVGAATVHASAEASDVYVAIDKLASLLDRQLRKAKTNKLASRVGAAHHGQAST